MSTVPPYIKRPGSENGDRCGGRFMEGTRPVPHKYPDLSVTGKSYLSNMIAITLISVIAAASKSYILLTNPSSDRQKCLIFKNLFYVFILTVFVKFMFQNIFKKWTWCLPKLYEYNQIGAVYVLRNEFNIHPSYPRITWVGVLAIYAFL